MIVRVRVDGHAHHLRLKYNVVEENMNRVVEYLYDTHCCVDAGFCTIV